MPIAELAKGARRGNAWNGICGEPALAYGRLYFASRDGCVYCFAPAKDGEPTTPEAIDQSKSAPLKDGPHLLILPNLKHSLPTEHHRAHDDHFLGKVHQPSVAGARVRRQ